MTAGELWAIVRDGEVLGSGSTPESAKEDALRSLYDPTLSITDTPFPCTTQLALTLASTPDAMLPPVEIRAEQACLKHEAAAVEDRQIDLFG